MIDAETIAALPDDGISDAQFLPLLRLADRPLKCENAEVA
jgi:hypothetical protein